MEGGFFLLQHVELEQDGQKVKGIEIIGHERQFGAEPSQEITSRFYDNLGNTPTTCTSYRAIPHDLGRREGSPAYTRVGSATTGDTVTGEWAYPGGGGYHLTATRAGRWHR
jgi:hypothetical protein